MPSRGSLTAVLDAARAGGARAAEVLFEEHRSLEQASARSRPVTAGEVRWTVRVWGEGGRAGVGTAPDADAARFLAAEAARVAPPDPLAGPIDRLTVRTGALGIDDRRWPALTDADRLEVLSLAERALDRSKLPLVQLRYRQRRVERAWASTRGVEAGEAATLFELAGAVRVGELHVAHRIASRHFSDVASLPFGPDLVRRAEGLARPAALPPAAWPVVLEPRVVAELVRALAPAFAAPAVRGGSFLKEWLGRPLADPVLHLTDDAGLFGALATRAFDDRGVPPIAVTLVREGVVNGLYHDPESARVDGLRPTGHVADGAVAPANLVVRPGSRTRNVILGELGRFLVLDRLPPFDVATGRFTGEVPVVVAERGERHGAARVRLDLHARELLGAFRELAADQERCCEVDAPSAVLELPLPA